MAAAVDVDLATNDLGRRIACEKGNGQPPGHHPRLRHLPRLHRVRVH